MTSHGSRQLDCLFIRLFRLTAIQTSKLRITGLHWGEFTSGLTSPTPSPPPHIKRVDGHDDVIKWKHFPCYWPFVRGIHRSLVNSSHKGQWRGASMFSLICAWINGWVNNRVTNDLRRHRAHYDVIVMVLPIVSMPWLILNDLPTT